MGMSPCQWSFVEAKLLNTSILMKGVGDLKSCRVSYYPLVYEFSPYHIWKEPGFGKKRFCSMDIYLHAVENSEEGSSRN